MYYIIGQDGQRYGPADDAQLALWVGEGRVVPTTMLQDVASGQQLQAAALPGLAFENPSSTPPAQLPMGLNAQSPGFGVPTGQTPYPVAGPPLGLTVVSGGGLTTGSSSARPNRAAPFLIAIGVLCLMALLGGGLWWKNSNSLPETQEHLLQPGDSWTYHMTCVLTTDDHGRKVTTPLEGTLTITEGRATIKGTEVLVETQTCNFEGDGKQYDSDFNQVRYVRQDPSTRDVHDFGDNKTTSGAIRLVTSETGVNCPGTWSNGLINLHRITYDTGESEQNKDRVIGSEVITLPLGTFRAWKTETETTGGGETTTGAQDYDPRLGVPLKQSSLASNPDGTGLKYDATLISTSVR